MMKSLSTKIAITALSLFLAGKSVQALTPENVSEIKTAFESNKQTYLILQDGSITPADKEGRIILGKDGKWISTNGKVMSVQFQSEAEKVLKLEKEKESKGIKLVDFFEYTRTANPKTGIKEETNCFNLWSDGTVSFGPYQIINENDWFYDANKSGKLDKGESYMKGTFNTKVNARIVSALSEVVSLREAQEKARKEKTELEQRIANLNSTIADYKNKSSSTADLNATLTEYTNKIKELTDENARLETQYNAQIKIINDSSKGLEATVTESADEVKSYSLPPSHQPIILDSMNLPQSTETDIHDENKMLREYIKNHPKTEIIQPTNISETKKIKNGLSLTLQPISDLKFEEKGAAVGIRYDIGLFGIGVLSNLSVSPDKVVETYVGTVSERTGRHAEGETAEIQRLSLGLGLEGRLGFFIAGAGVDYNSGVSKSDERIMKGTNTLASNTSSTPYNNFSWNAYAGAEVPIASWLKLGAVAGYDENSGFFGGLRGTFTIPLPDISVNVSVKPETTNSANSKDVPKNKEPREGRN